MKPMSPMAAASITGGALFLVLSIIARFIFHPAAPAGAHTERPVGNFPAKDPDNLYLWIAHIMGILWIGIGVFLAKMDRWVASSILEIFLEFSLPLLPFLLAGLALRLMGYSGKKK